MEIWVSHSTYYSHRAYAGNFMCFACFEQQWLGVWLILLAICFLIDSSKILHYRLIFSCIFENCADVRLLSLILPLLIECNRITIYVLFLFFTQFWLKSFSFWSFFSSVKITSAYELRFTGYQYTNITG